MKKIAVIIFGPPGSGKGTQSSFLASTMGFVHFDTGRFCESLVHDPDRQREKAIQRERKNFDTGLLMTPGFFVKELLKRVREIAKAGMSIVFSASPRSLDEIERELPTFEKLYGRKNIFWIFLKISPRASMKRNSSRFICSVCGIPFLSKFSPIKNPKRCGVCGGPLYKRTLDDPKVVKERILEYRRKTEPMIQYIRKHGYKIKEINGTPAPYVVFKQISAYVQNSSTKFTTGSGKKTL